MELPTDFLSLGRFLLVVSIKPSSTIRTLRIERKMDGSSNER